MKTSLSPALLFLVVLFAGVFLRTYDWLAIPFTHDEFSALFRTGYDTFGELIRKGVENDVHPAGIQVMLNYWIALVGDEPYLVKLPFLLSGLGALYLTYRLGCFWFHQTAGIVATTLVASIQPMVMYSQIARPYMSGIFMVLVAVWGLSRYLTTPYHRWAPYAGWILGAVGAAYNHYFSLLTVAVIGVLGLLIVPKRHLKSYLLSGFLIVLGFAPHIPITLGHLEMEGLGWLGPPDKTFFLDFLGYITHYSFLVQGLWLGLLILGLWFHFRVCESSDYQVRNFRYLLIGSLVIPALVGFWYSKAASPVLQFSSLIFGLPLFFIAGASFLPNFSVKWLSGLVVLLMVIHSYTLIAKRHHYRLLYENRYQATRTTLKADIQQYGSDKLTALLSLDPKIQNRWIKQSPLLRKAQISTLFNTSLSYIEDTLRKRDKPYLVLGFADGMNWTAFKIARSQYPYLLKVKNWHLGRYFLMAQEPHPDTTQLITQTFSPASMKADSQVYVPRKKQYGPSLEKSLEGHLSNPHDVLLASASFKKEDAKADPKVAVSLHKPNVDSAIIWRGATAFNPSDSGWLQAVAYIRLAGKQLEPSNLKVKAGIWDPSGKAYTVKDLQLDIIRGNRWFYGLRSPIPQPYE